MIHAYGTPEAPVPRLLAALARRGFEVGRPGEGAPAARAGGEAATLVLGPGVQLDELALGVLLGAWRRASGARVLVLSLVGAHPDARAGRLQQLWRLEEWARATSLPTLTLRLAPLVGPESPLWLKLRSQPRLPRARHRPLNPVDESDVLETLARALKGEARWEGWYEVAGSEALTLEDLATLAHEAGPAGAPGAWEPPLEELEEHRLCESEPWSDHFGFAPAAITRRAREWAR